MRMRSLTAIRSELLRLKWDIAASRFQLALRRHALALKAGFNPAQPRDDFGRWVDAGGRRVAGDQDFGGIATDFSAVERPRGLVGAARAAWKLIEAFRKATDIPDFFDRVSNNRTVAVSTIEGEDVFGSSSNWPSYTDADGRHANQMRATLMEKYPDVMNTLNAGQAPNNALFHAESNILMRAARKYGGSLAGKEFDVYVDRPMCSSCKRVLPLLSRELGSPTVRFIDTRGNVLVLRGDSWMD